MAVVGTATLNVVPKITGLAKAMEDEIAKCEGTSFKGGEKVGGSFGKGAAKSGAVVGAFAALTNKALDSIGSHVGSAVSRFDTLNNYPTVMQALGYSAADADSSISKMSDRLQSLPTRLDDMVSLVQGLVTTTGDLGKATDVGLALNDMLVAAGASTQLSSAAMEQFRQILAKGKPEMEDWRSLTSAMPGQMDQLAKAMLGPTAGANDLYAALGGGKNDPTITMDQLMDAMVRLDAEGGESFASFQSQAETAAGGVATAAANMGNAVTRGIAGVMDEIGKDNIAGAFNDMKSAINQAFGLVKPLVADAMPTAKRLYDTFRQMSPQLSAAAAGFVGMKVALPVLGDLASKGIALKKALDLAGAGGKTLTSAFAGVGLKLNPAALAITGVATAAGIAAAAYMDWKKKSDSLKAATTGLSDAVKRAGDLGGFAGTIADVGNAADESAQSVDELIESVGNHAAKISATNKEAEESLAVLNTAQGIISDYAGKTELTAQEQGKLQWALEQVNEQFGLTLTAADAAAGSYTDANGDVRDLKQSIDELVEAKKREILVNAYSEELGEAYKAQRDAVKAVEAAQDELTAAHERYNHALGDTSAGEGEYQKNLELARQGIESADKKLRDAKGAAEGANDAVNDLEKDLGDAAGAMYGAGDSAEALKTALQGMDDCADGFQAAGINVDDFSQKLSDAGVSTETLADIGGANLQALAEECGGNMDLMVWFIQHYNDTPIIDKDGNITVDQGELVDAQGNVYVWNGSTLVDKASGATVDDAELVDAQGNLWQWNGSQMQSKSASGTIYGNLKEAIRDRDNWNLGDLVSKFASATVDITRNIRDKITAGHAAGGIRPHADGGILPRYHARGAIATQAVPLDIVGEAGAEAIVPLTNERYSRPFAELIAKQVRGSDAKDLSMDAARMVIDALPGIISEYTPVMGEKEFGRKARKAVAYA